MSPPTTTPSSTRILADMGMSPDFDAFAKRNPKVIEARDRGHRIHAAAEDWLGFGDATTLTLIASASREEIALGRQVAEWAVSEGYSEIVNVEQRRYHSTLGYNGKPDFITRNPDTWAMRTTDLKTGSVRCASHVVQVASYVELELDTMPKGERPSRLEVDIVILYTASGVLEPVRVSPKDHMLAWLTFERAVHLWWWRQREGFVSLAKPIVDEPLPF